jgi:hypothetical protein
MTSVTERRASDSLDSSGLTSPPPSRPTANHDRHQGLTSPSEGRPPAVPQRINKAVAARDATVPTVASEWRSAVQPVESFRCLNPRCEAPGLIQKVKSKGRPQLFCSSKCRRAYDYERSQLLLDQEVLTAALGQPGGSFRQRRDVQSALATVRRCLSHYAYASNPPSEA